MLLVVVAKQSAPAADAHRRHTVNRCLVLGSMGHMNVVQSFWGLHPSAHLHA